jgi:cell division septation protein DedD
MNDVLAKRLLGACVLVGATLVLANLLPSPQALPPAEEHAKRVTYDLRQPPEVAKIESAPVVAATEQPAEQPIKPPAPPAQQIAKAAPPPHAVAVPKPAPTPKPAPVAKATPELKSAAEPRASAWYLQIGAFAQEDNATKTVAKLRDAGLQPHQDTITLKTGKRFRVRCGPFASQDEAEQGKVKAMQIGFADARVARD